MDKSKVETRLTKVARHWNEGGWADALSGAAALERDMLALPPVDPQLFGWARLYRLKGLHALHRWEAGLALIDQAPPVADERHQSPPRDSAKASTSSRVPMKLAQP